MTQTIETRRGFLQKLGLGAAAMVVAPSCLLGASKDPLRMDQNWVIENNNIRYIGPTSTDHRYTLVEFYNWLRVQEDF